MEQDKGATSVNRSERTLIDEAGRASHSPRFDERSIRRAQPAVPLDGAGASRRVADRPRPLAMLAALAAVVGLVAGAVGASVYMSRRASPRASVAPAVETAPATQPQPAASEEELFKPAAGDLPDVSPPETTPAAETGDAAASSSTTEREAGAGGAAPAADEQAALRDSLAGWLDATNARDIGRQMSYYDSRLDAFYLSRNTSARAVRAEKVRVLGGADAIDVQANGPAAIRLGPDGRTATMRFRKRYRVAAGGRERRGEVVQELRWRKTGDGWKIVSERDVRVLN